METLLSALKRYTSFSGRAGQGEAFTMLLAIWLIALVLVLALGSGRLQIPQWPGHYVLLIGGTGPAAALLTLGIYTPLFATMARRLHDQGMTAWLALAMPIPFLALDMFTPIAMLTPLTFTIIMIGISAGPGKPGPNRYGPDPRERFTRSAAT